jgi:hypothetical protein
MPGLALDVLACTCTSNNGLRAGDRHGSAIATVDKGLDKTGMGHGADSHGFTGARIGEREPRRATSAMTVASVPSPSNTVGPTIWPYVYLS